MSLVNINTNNTNNALDIQGVVHYYGGVCTVNHVDMSVPYGARWVVLGPNGAGKTTLFNLIAGDLSAFAGSIEFCGNDITRLPTKKRVALGMRRTYQNAMLFGGLTVRHNLLLAVLGATGGWHSVLPVAMNKNSKDKMEEVERCAQQVKLMEHLDEQVDSLSHGVKRQLEIGMALVGEPKLLLFDEPAAGLSPAERELLTSLIKGLSRDITLIMIEHDMDIALQLADFVTVLSDGKKIAEGTSEEVISDEHVHSIYVGGKIKNER